MENENWGSNYDRDTETMIAFISSVILTEMVPNVHVPNNTCIFDKTKGAKTHFPPIPTHTLTNIPNRGGEGGTVDRIVLVKFITAYQTIWHSLHAHVKIHVVRIVASWLINTHRWLHAEQETMAVT